MFKTQVLLNEGWDLLTEAQQNTLVYSERRLVPLLEELAVLFENKLTPDQVESLFGAAEQVATDGGGNRTALGKAKDIAGLPVKVTKQIDAAIKDVAKKAQNTAPVKNFDAQFEKLKQKIIEKVGGEDAKIVQMLKQYGQWAKENPGKSMLILSLLSAAASLTVGGGAAAAAVGFMFKLGNQLVQGEKLSSALGSGMYGAAIGWLSGMAFKWLSDTVIDNIAMGREAELEKMLDGMDRAAREANVSKVAKEFPGVDLKALTDTTTFRESGRINAFFYKYDIIINPEQKGIINKLTAAANEAWSRDGMGKSYYQNAAKLHEYLASIQANTQQQSILRSATDALLSAKASGASLEQVQPLMRSMNDLDALYATAKSISADVAAAVQGAVSQVEKSKQNMHQAKPVSEEEKQAASGEQNAEVDSTEAETSQTESRYLHYQNRDLELIYEQIAQEGMLDNIKDFGSKAGGAIKSGLGTARDKMGQIAQSDTGQKVSGMMKQAGGAVANVAGKSLAAAGQAGKNLTTKITKDKLMKAWTKSGSPTDVGSIVNIMQDAGVTPEMLQSIEDVTKIKLPETQPKVEKPQPKAAEPQQKQIQPQQTKTNAFKYTGKSKNVSAAIDKVNSSGVDKELILQYIRSKRQQA